MRVALDKALDFMIEKGITVALKLVNSICLEHMHTYKRLKLFLIMLPCTTTPIG